MKNYKYINMYIQMGVYGMHLLTSEQELHQHMHDLITLRSELRVVKILLAHAVEFDSIATSRLTELDNRLVQLARLTGHGLICG